MPPSLSWSAVLCSSLYPWDCECRGDGRNVRSRASYTFPSIVRRLHSHAALLLFATPCGFALDISFENRHRNAALLLLTMPYGFIALGVSFKKRPKGSSAAATSLICFSHFTRSRRNPSPTMIKVLMLTVLCAVAMTAAMGRDLDAAAVGRSPDTATMVSDLDTVMRKASRKACKRKYDQCTSDIRCYDDSRCSISVYRVRDSCCECSRECRSVSRWKYRNRCYTRAGKLGRKC